MTTINTNGINVNYPVPGENNSTQPFRDNFTAIKKNLDTAGTEITDLQNKAVLKAALDGSVLNNDMANAVISNAATRSFRATTYNLGNALSGTVLINAALADVHYGNVASNVTLQFGSWAPVNTESAITLRLGISNSSAVITFPSQVVASNNNFGGTILENYANIDNVVTITAPHDVRQLEFRLRTLDCGNTISIEPINRPYQSTQIAKRTPPSTGQVGDIVGTICIDTDSNAVQLLVPNTYANDNILTSDTSTLYRGQPVVFTGTTFGGVTSGTTYYVNAVSSSTEFNIATSGDGNVSNVVNLSSASGTMYLNPINYMYIATANYSASSYNRNITSTTSPNIITVSGSTANLAVNKPIVFDGTISGNTANISLNEVYYIKSVSGSNITISKTRYNGVSGPEFTNIITVGSGNVNIDYTVYDGPDIFKRIPLQPF
jgi:hypothetical protein